MRHAGSQFSVSALYELTCPPFSKAFSRDGCFSSFQTSSCIHVTCLLFPSPSLVLSLRARPRPGAVCGVTDEGGWLFLCPAECGGRRASQRPTDTGTD